MNSTTSVTKISAQDKLQDSSRLTSIKTDEECIILGIVDTMDTEDVLDPEEEVCKKTHKGHRFRHRSHRRFLCRHSHRHHQNVRDRLMDMGLVPGTWVKVLQNQNRGPILLVVRDSRLAIGRGMAGKIVVCKAD